VVVWDGGGASGHAGAAGFLQGMGRSLPPMMQVLRDIAGVELPEFVAKMSPDVMPLPATDGARRNGGEGAVTATGTTPPANGTAGPVP
jgi:hypothetical protein